MVPALLALHLLAANPIPAVTATPQAALRVIVVNSASVGEQGGGLTEPVSIDDNGGSLTVDGPLTDAQMRAADVKITLDGETVPVTGTFWQATQPVSGPVTDAQLRASPLPVDIGPSIEVSVLPSVAISQTLAANDVDVVTLPALAAGTNNIGDVDVLTIPALPAGTNNIGDVDVLTLPALPAGNNNIGDVDVATLPNVAQATASSLNAEVQGDAAHAAGVSGNPLLGGAYAEADAAQLDSTNVVEGDITRLKADVEGRLLVSTAHVNRFNCTMSSTATASTSVTGCAAPGAGLSRYITDIYFSNSAASATNANTIQTGTGSNCGTGTAVIFRCASPASATCGGSFQTPIKEAANVDTCFLSATAGTKTIQIMGFIAP